MLIEYPNFEEIEIIYQELLKDNQYIDINDINLNGTTLLGFAILHHHVPMVKLLTKMRCNPNTINRFGYHIISYCNHDEIFDEILSMPTFDKKFALKHIVGSSGISLFDNLITYKKFIDNFKDEILQSVEIDILNLALYTYQSNIEEKNHEERIEIWEQFNETHSLTYFSTDLFFKMFQYYDKALPFVIGSSSSLKDNKTFQKKFTEIKEYIKEHISSIHINFNQEIIDSHHPTSTLERINTMLGWKQISIFLDKYRYLPKNNKEHTQFLEIEWLWDCLTNLAYNNSFDDFHYTANLWINNFIHHWKPHYVSHVDNCQNSQISQLLKQYGITKLTFNKDCNPDTLFIFLKECLNLCHVNFSFDDYFIGNNKISIHIGEIYNPTQELEEAPCCGNFSPAQETLNIISNYQQFAKSPDNYLKETITSIEFKKTFIHEYTHFLQYRASFGQNKEEHGILKSFFFHHNKDWSDIMNILYTKNTYSQEQCLHFLLDSFEQSLSKDDISIVPNVKKEISSLLSNYIYLGVKKSYKDLKNVIDLHFKDFEEYNDYFFYNVKIISYAYRNQKHLSFQQSLWEKINQVESGGKFNYDSAIEIHARLMEEFVENHRTILPNHILSSINPLDRENILKKIDVALPIFNHILQQYIATIENHQEYMSINKKSRSKIQIR